MRFLKRFTVPIIVGIPVFIGLLLLLFQSGNSSNGGSGVGFKRLGVVHVEGAIFEAESIINQLKELNNDNLIAGVLLRINSPGGATAPSQEIYSAVKQFRKKNKPIIVSMGTIAASGGYYIACPADRIFADPGTLTGSIGVIMTVPLYKELAQKIGIDMRTFKSGDFKDLANPYRTMSESERRMIQELLNDTHNQFIDDVARARSIDRDSLLEIADGRVFTGRQALDNHLIDTLGTYEEALTYLRKITGLGQSARIINKKEPSIRMREWFVKELVHIFPPLYRIIAPIGMHCLTIIE